MFLFIVESPAKAKTIKQYLGKDYEVIASMGHIRELVPADGSVDTDNGFKMKYQIIERSKPQVKKIADLAKRADKIYLASDPDREGEAISQALYDVLLEKKVARPEQFFRVSYTEITKKAIEEALKNTRTIDNNLVDAQQARSALDYLVGFNLSPVLWRKLPGSKSAGRVQSVALRMIVDREFEIKDFKPEEYWSIESLLRKDGSVKVSARIVKYNGNTFGVGFPKNEALAGSICEQLRKAGKMEVVKNDTKDVKQSPCPPFTTALLQQEAVRKLGFSSKKTMTIAQRLYEGVNIKGKPVALITYMRTDGMSLSNDAIRDIRSTIVKDFGSEYLPEKAIFYKTKSKNAQEAHEAIRPTHVDIKPSDIKDDIEYDAWRLYDLIWKRTVACQMMSAIFARQTIDLESKIDGNLIYGRINGNRMKFDGYLAVYHIQNALEDDEGDENSKVIPDLRVGEQLDVEKVSKEQHFTSPPARYGEASLIKTLESYGIGRPSTYATIISVLQDRGYVELEKRQFVPTSRGIVVSVFLKEFFKKYVEYDFTSNLEEGLDLISSGKLDRVEFLTDFWSGFHKNVNDVLNENNEDILKPLSREFLHYFLSGDAKCPKCGGEIGLKKSRFGVFWGCNNYPECKYMTNLEATSSNASETFDSQRFGKIVIKNGKYGKYCEFSKDGKLKQCSLPENAEITDEILDFYLDLPKVLGKDSDGNDVKVGIGRFGPYVLSENKFYSCKFAPLFKITLSDALEIIAEKKANPGIKRKAGKSSSNKVSKKTTIKKSRTAKNNVK